MNKLLNVYSIRDTKASIYHAPQYFHTHGEAERWLNDMVNNAAQSPVSKFPEDFDLFHLGTYDQDNGLIDPLQTPTHIVKALHLKRETKE